MRLLPIRPRSILAVGASAACLAIAALVVAASFGRGSELLHSPNAVEHRLTGEPAEYPGWPKLLGPTGTSSSSELGLRVEWFASGPPVVWRREIGSGYSAPAVTDDGLLVLHRVDNDERLECLDPATGRERWVAKYPTRYKCQYRYSSGPYSTPVIDEDLAYAQSAEGELRCLDMRTGKVVWKRELSREFEVPEADWAVGHRPLHMGRSRFHQSWRNSRGGGDRARLQVGQNALDGHRLSRELRHACAQRLKVKWHGFPAPRSRRALTSFANPFMAVHGLAMNSGYDTLNSMRLTDSKRVTQNRCARCIDVSRGSASDYNFIGRKPA
jgi:hypothetical protein